MANTLLINWKVHSEISCRLLAALSILKKYERLGDEVIVTNRGLTEDIRDRGMWINVVLDEGRPVQWTAFGRRSEIVYVVFRVQ